MATSDDVGAIAAVHVASWQVAYEGLLDAAYLASRTVSLRTRQWRKVLADRTSDHVLVVDFAGTVVGFTHIGPVEDPAPEAEDGVGEVHTLYLRPDHMGKGAGGLLLSAAESRLAADGFDVGCLWVLTTNHRARRFYERQGWSLTDSVRTQMYGDGGGTDIRYHRPLP